MATTHLIVGNPTAQSGKNRERIDQALRLFRDAGVTADLLPTLPEGRTTVAVRDALDGGGYRVVVAMGGDGTFREVAAGLYTSRAREAVTLGLLPTGTANDQGKSFGLEASAAALGRNVQVIVAGNETRLDAGVLRQAGEPPVHFFDSAGWGLSARVLSRRNQDRRAINALGPLDLIYRDHAVYAGAFLRTFLESYVVDDRMHATVVLDGVRHELEGITDLIIKNTRVYAGAWVFDKASRHDDGVFEVVPFRGKRDWTSKAIIDLEGNPLSEPMRSEIGVQRSEPMRAANIELELTMPERGATLAAQLDGEEWPASPRVFVDVLPRALRVLVP